MDPALGSSVFSLCKFAHPNPQVIASSASARAFLDLKGPGIGSYQSTHRLPTAAQKLYPEEPESRAGRSFIDLLFAQAHCELFSFFFF